MIRRLAAAALLSTTVATALALVPTSAAHADDYICVGLTDRRTPNWGEGICIENILRNR